MSTESILVIDTGTSGMKAVLFDGRGGILRSSSRNYSPEFSADGRVEQDADIWIKGLNTVASECLDGLPSPRAVALTSARSSLIPVDHRGNALSKALMWLDKRSEAICHELKSEDSFVYSTTGMALNTISSASKMTWIRREAPEIYAKASKLVCIQDFLIHYLCGCFVTDHSFGNRSLLMDLKDRRWSPDLLKLFNVEEVKLCELIPPGSLCGRVKANASSSCGIPTGTPVYSAGGDQQCAAIGEGVLVPKKVSVNIGTGAYIIRSTGLPVLDPGRGLFCNVASVDNQYIIEATVPAAGSLYNWICNLFGSYAEEGRGLYRRIDKAISKSPRGARGVIAIPSFSGRGSPAWDAAAKGCFLNLSLSTTSGDLARALLEGIAGELKDNIDLMRNLAGKESSIRTSGGLSGFSLFNQMLADSFNAALRWRQNKESTALGAWIVTAKSLGFFANLEEAYNQAQSGKSEEIFNPDAEGRQFFERLAVIRKDIYRTLHEKSWLIDQE